MIEPVSANRLLENGNFCRLGRRLQPILTKAAILTRLEIRQKCTKSLLNTVFLMSTHQLSLVVRLAGWRRSADRACLQTNSLLTGNFTGKLAILVGRRHDL